MKKNLTIRLDSQLVDRANEYAIAHGTSLAKMVESYLQAIGKPNLKESPVSPLVQSLTGVINLTDQAAPENQHREYLQRKYKG